MKRSALTLFLTNRTEGFILNKERRTYKNATQYTDIIYDWEILRKSLNSMISTNTAAHFYLPSFTFTLAFSHFWFWKTLKSMENKYYFYRNLWLTPNAFWVSGILVIEAFFWVILVVFRKKITMRTRIPEAPYGRSPYADPLFAKD